MCPGFPHHLQTTAWEILQHPELLGGRNFAGQPEHTLLLPAPWCTQRSPFVLCKAFLGMKYIPLAPGARRTSRMERRSRSRGWQPWFMFLSSANHSCWVCGVRAPGNGMQGSLISGQGLRVAAAQRGWGHSGAGGDTTPSQPSCRHPVQVEDDLKASGPSSEVSWVVAPSGPGGHPILGRLGSWRSCLLALIAPSLSPGLRLSEEQKCLIPQLVGERC